jgi:chemotaxis protein MotB
MHPAAAQLAELERRIRLLDDNNRQLTTQLAQSQQQMQVFRDRSDLLARQLQDANGQLSQARLAQAQFTQQVQGMQASMQARGGAKLVANNSLARQADSLRGLGFPVQIDGDVVRITLPADQLFQTGSAQLNPNAAGVLDKFADVLARQFPRQRVGIEAHTDTVTSPSSPLANPQQLSSAQSVAVYEYLTKRSAIPTNQLFSLAHGASMPVADNQNPMGRAQNRRIELVIYPETF